MPELPEVETVVRQLAPLLQGRMVNRLEVLDPKLAGIDRQSLAGRRIENISRLGKQIGIELSGGGPGDKKIWIAFHLRMTGRLFACLNGERPDSRHLRAKLVLDQGALLFYDIRRFGTIRLAATAGELLPAAVDPMSAEFTAEKLAELIGSTSTPVKPWLMRQDRLVGIGNIYACEILFRCGLNPCSPAGQLPSEQIVRLHEQTRRVLEQAIEKCGTTFSDFQDSHGQSGGFQEFLKVYGRKGERCSHCGSAIERIVQQQRSTFFCPECQR
jgi:formamidopyrimidine-DNA glycosylase